MTRFLVRLGAVVFMLGSSALFPASRSHAAVLRPGQLGEVKIIVRGLGEQPPNGAWKAGKIRDPLYNRYFLRTKRRQKARLKFLDGTTLNLNQRTDAVLADPHHLIVRQGEVDQVDVKGSTHHIAGNAAAATGLGTNYDVKVIAGKVFITVVQGQVVVKTSGGSVIVRPNQQTTVRGRLRPSKPRHVNALAVIAWVRGLDTNGWYGITSAEQSSRTFSSISGLVAGAQGHLFGATNLGVVEFTSTGKKIRAFGSQELYGGIAIDSSNYLYVAMSGGIAKYTVAGRRVALLGSTGSADNPSALANAPGVAVDSHGSVYVTGGDDSKVTKLSPSGSVIATWGTPQLQYHGGITVDRHDNVYVVAGKGAEAGNIVQKLSPSGQVLAQWEIVAAKNIRPFFKYIAVDGRGRIFLTAPAEYDPSIHGITGESSVYELTYKGVLRTIWGRRRAIWPSPGAFITPSGIAVDKKGNVYVGDNYRLQKLPWFDT